MAFPGTVTDRRDERESEAVLKKPAMGLSLGVLGPVGWVGFEAGPWLLALTPVDSIWSSSAIPGLKLEEGFWRKSGVVPWIALEPSSLPVGTADMEMRLTPWGARLDVGPRSWLEVRFAPSVPGNWLGLRPKLELRVELMLETELGLEPEEEVEPGLRWRV